MCELIKWLVRSIESIAVHIVGRSSAGTCGLHAMQILYCKHVHIRCACIVHQVFFISPALCITTLVTEAAHCVC